ncbi:hypothetical protein JTB14_008922 [Gonioctena quinquepunctata]|nr:hypothetical protein JTB14_008922 [Gonioctena quinquepunctata]
MVRRNVLQPNHAKRQDVLLPSISPGFFQHIAREPNTNLVIPSFQNKLKRDEEDKLQEERAMKLASRESITIKYDKHAEKRRFQRLIQERVKQKLQAYEETVEIRRQKLQELLCKEEREYHWETVKLAQKSDEVKMEEMKRRSQLLRVRREEERLKIVHEKRIEQFRNRCQELRPSLFNKHLVETKNTQLQQMRENEARREADKELDKMWDDLILKEARAKLEREEQELIARKRNQLDLQSVWDKQIKGKELLKAEKEKVAQEDRIEMEKLREQLRREEIQALDAKRRKRDRTANELLEQIATQAQLLAQRKEDEEAVDRAFDKLAKMEMEREQQASHDFTSQYRRETAMYKKHLLDLEEEQKKEEKELFRLLDIHRQEIEKKQDEARCKVLEAKRKLQKDVLQGRDEQLALKRQEAENQLKLKQAENELLQMAFEKNERLQAESDRLEGEAVRQYREDLQMQIAHNNILRDREKQELQRQMEEGRKEEEKYKKIVADMIVENVQNVEKHPFRRVLENYDCRCTPNCIP